MLLGFKAVLRAGTARYITVVSIDTSRAGNASTARPVHSLRPAFSPCPACTTSVFMECFSQTYSKCPGPSRCDPDISRVQKRQDVDIYHFLFFKLFLISSFKPYSNGSSFIPP